MSTIQAVLFDLDGTLIDTAPDLIEALNQALHAHGYPREAAEKMRPFVSHGSLAMVQAAQPQLTEAEHLQLQQALLTAYTHCNGQQSRLFDGFESVLQYFDQHHIPYGIITNKPARFTRPLLDKLGLTSRLSCIISADTCTRYKPNPEPMRLGAMQTQVLPEHILYVGDHVRDIVAAKAVNMQSAAALWGYIEADDDPEQWQADHCLTTASELVNLL